MNKTPLEALAKAHIDGRMAYKIVRFEQLNPEQKLAYVLERLVEHKKGELELMGALKLLAEECVAWRQTPEGKKWHEDRQKRRVV